MPGILDHGVAEVKPLFLYLRLLLLAPLCVACATTAVESSAQEPGVIVHRERPNQGGLVREHRSPDPQESLDAARALPEDGCDPPEAPTARPEQSVAVIQYDAGLGRVTEHYEPLISFPTTLQFKCRNNRWVRLAYVVEGIPYGEDGETSVACRHPGYVDSVTANAGMTAAEKAAALKRWTFEWDRWCHNGNPCFAPRPHVKTSETCSEERCRAVRAQ